jgi:hypothetical protein
MRRGHWQLPSKVSKSGGECFNPSLPSTSYKLVFSHISKSFNSDVQTMADASTAKLSEPHTPKSASIEAFKNAFPDIKNEFHKTRHQWDEHEPEMFARVQHHTDHELLENVNLDKDLVQVRTGESAYVVLG